MIVLSSKELLTEAALKGEWIANYINLITYMSGNIVHVDVPRFTIDTMHHIRTIPCTTMLVFINIAFSLFHVCTNGSVKAEILWENEKMRVGDWIDHYFIPP